MKNMIKHAQWFTLGFMPILLVAFCLLVVEYNEEVVSMNPPLQSIFLLPVFYVVYLGLSTSVIFFSHLENSKKSLISGFIGSFSVLTLTYDKLGLLLAFISMGFMLWILGVAKIEETPAVVLPEKTIKTIHKSILFRDVPLISPRNKKYDWLWMLAEPIGYLLGFIILIISKSCGS